MASGSCCLRWRHGQSQITGFVPVRGLTAEIPVSPTWPLSWVRLEHLFRKGHHSACCWHGPGYTEKINLLWSSKERKAECYILGPCLRSLPRLVPLSSKKKTDADHLMLSSSTSFTCSLSRQCCSVGVWDCICRQCFSLCISHHWLLRVPVLWPPMATGPKVLEVFAS